MIRTQYFYVQHHPEELTIIINPAKIAGYIHKRSLTEGLEQAVGRVSGRLENLASGLCHALYPFVIPPYVFDKYNRPIAIEHLDTFKKVDDLVRTLNSGNSIEHSQWYHNLHHQLKTKGITKYKKIIMRNKSQLDHFFNAYVMKTVESMQNVGYLSEKATVDVPLAIIGRNGQIYKSNKGRHRFCFARALGVRRFPVRIIGVHGDWLKENKVFPINKDFDPKLFQLLKEVEHLNS